MLRGMAFQHSCSTVKGRSAMQGLPLRTQTSLRPRPCRLQQARGKQTAAGLWNRNLLVAVLHTLSKTHLPEATPRAEIATQDRDYAIVDIGGEQMFLEEGREQTCHRLQVGTAAGPGVASQDCSGVAPQDCAGVASQDCSSVASQDCSGVASQDCSADIKLPSLCRLHLVQPLSLAGCWHSGRARSSLLVSMLFLQVAKPSRPLQHSISATCQRALICLGPKDKQCPEHLALLQASRTSKT